MYNGWYAIKSNKILPCLWEFRIHWLCRGVRLSQKECPGYNGEALVLESVEYMFMAITRGSTY